MAYWEKIVVILIVVAAVVGVVWYIRRESRKTCSCDCGGTCSKKGTSCCEMDSSRCASCPFLLSNQKTV